MASVFPDSLVIEAASVVVSSTTPMRLSSASAAAGELLIEFSLQADEGNTGDVYIGDSSVTANVSLTLDAKDERRFGELRPYGKAHLSYDLTQFWALGSSAGDRVKVIKTVRAKNKS